MENTSGADCLITVIILTFNEAQHIGRCIESLQGLPCCVRVVDSFSTDDTVQIAKSLGAEVYRNSWVNYSDQFSWAMLVAPISTKWVMRLDADEFLTSELKQSIFGFVSEPCGFNSAYFKRRIVFMGKAISHGFFYPALMLRLWIHPKGAIESRWMDEHIIVQDACTATLHGDLIDHNLNDLSWWSSKHIGYAMREVYDIVWNDHVKSNSVDVTLTGKAKIKRFIKNKFYNCLPRGFRSMAYFFYRYVVGVGFLDGLEGFYFHFLQGCWYRTFVDAKLVELEKQADERGISAFQLLEERGIWTARKGTSRNRP